MHEAQFFTTCRDCFDAGRGLVYPEATTRAGNPTTPVHHDCVTHAVAFVRRSKLKAVAYWNSTYGFELC
jgi:hypothetical protein